jgi:hypothetical protein
MKILNTSGLNITLDKDIKDIDIFVSGKKEDCITITNETTRDSIVIYCPSTGKNSFEAYLYDEGGTCIRSIKNTKRK